MNFSAFVASLLAAASIQQSADDQPVFVHTRDGRTSLPTDDTPEEIAEDAARDLRDSRFYNRPGATRAQYDAEWQECRLIARGSLTPGGNTATYYNPMYSPMANAVGGLIGGLIAGAIAEGEMRRANRRACLLMRGWRLVEVDRAEAARVAAMNDSQRSAYFDTIVGAEHVEGQITERTSFSLAPDSALRLDAPVEGPGAIYLGRRIDPAVPIELEPGEGAVVMAFRRPDEGSAGRSGTINFARYDMTARDLYSPEKDSQRTEAEREKATYAFSFASRDRRAPLEVQVVRVSPGDYVVTGFAVGRGVAVTNSFCFGAPTFHVGAGEVVYVGDFVPYINAGLSTGGRYSGVAWTSHLEDARRTLAVSQSGLAAALAPAALRNQATYTCAAVTMDRWDLPGVEALADPVAATARQAAATPEATAVPAAGPAISSEAPDATATPGSTPAPAEALPVPAEAVPTPAGAA